MATPTSRHFLIFSHTPSWFEWSSSWCSLLQYTIIRQPSLHSLSSFTLWHTAQLSGGIGIVVVVGFLVACCSVRRKGMKQDDMHVAAWDQPNRIRAHRITCFESDNALQRDGLLDFEKRLLIQESLHSWPYGGILADTNYYELGCTDIYRWLLKGHGDSSRGQSAVEDVLIGHSQIGSRFVVPVVVVRMANVQYIPSPPFVVIVAFLVFS